MKTDRKETGGRNLAGIPYGELIRRGRKDKGLSQEELGALARVGKNAVGAWEAGRSRPDLSSVPVICEALGMTVNGFFGIEDAPAGRKPPPEAETAFTDRYFRLNDYHRQVILREMDVLIDMQEKQPAPSRRVIRIYRSDLAACAGPGWGLGEAAGEAVWVYEDGATAQADEIIRVSGDSMEPRYHDGDEVLVRHASSVRPGEIGIFVCGDAGYIKEYRREGLKSLNPAYPLMVFSENEEVRCIGKVIGTMRAELYAEPADIERATASAGKG